MVGLVSPKQLSELYVLIVMVTSLCHKVKHVLRKSGVTSKDRPCTRSNIHKRCPVSYVCEGTDSVSTNLMNCVCIHPQDVLLLR